MKTDKKTMGLWRNNGVGGGKFLVQRRDGTVPEWPYMVLGARDAAAPAALRAYADASEALGYDPEYVADVRALADEFEAYAKAHGPSAPDEVPSRQDNPEVTARMKNGA